MCNIVEIPCKICGQHIGEEIHIMDWIVEPEALVVYCKDCLPDNNIRIFKLSQIIGKWALELKEVNQIGIRYLTKKAIENKDGIYPNTVFEINFIDL